MQKRRAQPPSARSTPHNVKICIRLYLSIFFFCSPLLIPVGWVEASEFACANLG